MTFVTDCAGSSRVTGEGLAQARMSVMTLAEAQKQILSKVLLFSGLSESEMDFLSKRIVPRHYSAGEIVFNESDPCSGLYVVASGHIRIFKTSASGREQVLSVDGPGSSVAELPVFDGGNYPASVVAVEQATLLFVSKQDFQKLCLAH